MDYVARKKNPETCIYRVIDDNYSDITFCKNPGTCEYKTPFTKTIEIKGAYIHVAGMCTPI